MLEYTVHDSSAEAAMLAGVVRGLCPHARVRHCR
jgi:hypothetical protein